MWVAGQFGTVGLFLRDASMTMPGSGSGTAWSILPTRPRSLLHLLFTRLTASTSMSLTLNISPIFAEQTRQEPIIAGQNERKPERIQSAFPAQHLFYRADPALFSRLRFFRRTAPKPSKPRPNKLLGSGTLWNVVDVGVKFTNVPPA